MLTQKLVKCFMWQTKFKGYKLPVKIIKIKTVPMLNNGKVNRKEIAETVNNME